MARLPPGHLLAEAQPVLQLLLPRCPPLHPPLYPPLYPAISPLAPSALSSPIEVEISMGVRAGLYWEPWRPPMQQQPLQRRGQKDLPAVVVVHPSTQLSRKKGEQKGAAGPITAAWRAVAQAPPRPAAAAAISPAIGG